MDSPRRCYHEFLWAYDLLQNHSIALLNMEYGKAGFSASKSHDAKIKYVQDSRQHNRGILSV